jgi:hypothetical protein
MPIARRSVFRDIREGCNLCSNHVTKQRMLQAAPNLGRERLKLAGILVSFTDALPGMTSG